jgi:hypothetical protein
VAGSPGASSADPTERLEDAKAQLADLTLRIRDRQAAVEDARMRAVEAGERAAEAGEALVPLSLRQIQLHRQIDGTKAELAAVQAALADAAADAFMTSPGTVAGADLLTAFLDADSLIDLQDRLAFNDAVVAERQRAVAKVEAVKARLEAEARVAETLLEEARRVRARRDAALAEQAAALSSEQAALAELGIARDQIVALIDRLRAKLAPADVAAVAAVFQGDHNISYGEWAHAFLRVMGVPRCHENLVVTIAWQAQEGTQAAWNPLATTHRMPGSTDFNSVGVQNFLSLEQGLQATRETIQGGWDIYGYGAIIRSMEACMDAMDTARAIAASRWCYGCVGGFYVMGIVPKVEAAFETYAAL